MKGKVVHIHQQRGMVAVLTDDGEYSIIELSGDDISYIPTREAFPRGGYTVYACRFEPGIAEAMVDTALEALAEAAG